MATEIEDCIAELNLTISELHKKLIKNQEKFRHIESAMEDMEQAIGKLFFMQKVTFNNMKLFAKKMGIPDQEIIEKDLYECTDIDKLKDSLISEIKKYMGI